MNEFTKDELHRLYSLTKIFDGEAIVPLRNKIQSMINNYCEPINEDNPMYRCIRCDSKAVDIWYEIKYGLHNWFLCVGCSPQFRDWVLDKNADSGCSWAKLHFKRKCGDTNDN